jgi:hypothetical protein
MHLSPLDWIFIACLAIPAIYLSVDTSMKQTDPQSGLANRLPASIRTPKWNHVPLALLIVAGLVFAVRAIGIFESAPPPHPPASASVPAWQSLRRQYVGRPRIDFSENLTTIERLLNGRGRDAVNKAEPIIGTLRMTEDFPRRYQSFASDLAEVGAALKEVRETIWGKMLPGFYDQSEDLNDILQSDDRLSQFEQAVVQVSRSFIAFKNITDIDTLNEGAKFSAVVLFNGYFAPLSASRNDFNQWIADCSSRIAAKRKALGP